jgi:hypothetical protein
VVNTGGPEAEASLNDLDEFGRVVTEPFTTRVPDKDATRILQKSSDQTVAGASVAFGASTQGKIGIDSTSVRAIETERSINYAVASEDKIVFPAVSSHLRSILARLGSQLYILVDEWSSLPTDVQPYLAEFFKRAFLALPLVRLRWNLVVGGMKYGNQYFPSACCNCLSLMVKEIHKTAIF